MELHVPGPNERKHALPPTSLIIPSRNRPDLLQATVDSLLAGEEVPTELILVDQSDQPHHGLSTLTPDRPCHIQYLWEQSVGVSRARNVGIVAAHHDILVFIDDDEIVPSTWFGTIVRALMESGDGSAVTGQVLALDAETDGGFAPSTITDTSPVVYRGRVDRDVLYSNNMAMYRSAFDRIGLFDERLGVGAPYRAATDNDCGYLLLEAGYCIVYAPEAVLYHRAWRGKDDYLSVRWNYGFGRGAYYAKHLRFRDHYMLRRMLRDLRAHVEFFLRDFRHDRSKAYGEAVFTLGLIAGGVKWIVWERRW